MKTAARSALALAVEDLRSADIGRSRWVEGVAWRRRLPRRVEMGSKSFGVLGLGAILGDIRGVDKEGGFYYWQREVLESLGLSGVHQELAEGDRELARKGSGVRQKETKRLTRISSGVAEKLVGSNNLDVHEVVGTPGIDEDGDGLLLEETSDLHHLRIHIAG
ncbi:hypothetical protein BHM03_00034492 [Ensete ventricosum]|nr:hypothetical protein BHM03_00034492 [Ensete ventricosum]